MASGPPIQLSFALPWLKPLVSPLDRKIYLAVLSSLRQMYSSRKRTPGHRKNTGAIQTGALAEG